MSRLLRCIFLCFLPAIPLQVNAQNPFGFDLENGATTVELAFKQESNLIIVPIKINGLGPYNFILDTGSESGMIFEKWVIAENNWVNARKIPIYSKEGDKVTDLLVANNLEINLEGVSGVQQTMLVLDDDVIDIKNVLGTDVHGVLGSELFSRFVVEVDYQNKKLLLHDPATFKKPQKFKSIPIEIEKSKPYIRVDIRQKGHKKVDVKLLVDTGASSALFLDEKNNEEIILPKKRMKRSLGRGLAGVVDGQIGRVKKLKFAGYKFSQVTTSFPDDWAIGSENYLQNDESVIRHGTLGADVLVRFHVIFDYMNKQMYVKKNQYFENPFVFNTAGMNVVAVGQDLNEYLVREVIDGSPAKKAGIEIGDEIISLNGKPAFFYSLTEVNNMLKDWPGTLLIVIFKRKDDLIKKTLKLKRLL